ncbi:hypothetical protein ABPG74_018052 [Tetrahymena malaccensis]
MKQQQQIKQTNFQVNYQIEKPTKYSQVLYKQYEEKLFNFYLEQKAQNFKYQILDQVQYINQQKQAENVCFWFQSKNYKEQTDYQHILKHLKLPQKSKEKEIRIREDIIRLIDTRPFFTILTIKKLKLFAKECQKSFFSQSKFSNSDNYKSYNNKYKQNLPRSSLSGDNCSKKQPKKEKKIYKNIKNDLLQLLNIKRQVLKIVKYKKSQKTPNLLYYLIENS